ncbi:sporulation protein [Thermostaphylospora chromogena]|uniref:Sporulation-control protein n=1 Tax=Thermostaphylospora chromogena TaxID=35622 RepID=A0A1H1GFW0_9ACTN|nr:sporulation protein [Thermostaphylospora chromogena]SDR11963.1 sporulation-control protein [Thermostaphylospora chromogena]
MVFRKLMAVFGAGVEVDTVLRDTNVRPGDLLRGEVRFRGGSSDHRVDGIFVDFTAVVEVERGDSEFRGTFSFLHAQVAGAFELAAGAAHAVPFEIAVPWETPISAIGGRPLRGMRLGVATELSLAGALDKGDLDPLLVNPLPAQEHVLAALDRMGFRFKGADLEEGTLPGSTMPFYQEIEYYAGPRWRRHFNELELTFIAGPASVDVILEADRKGGLLTAGRDVYTRFTVRYDDPPAAAERALNAALQAMARRRGWFF